jgi:peptide deformylase
MVTDMTLTALDQHDSRLRQVCARLTKAQLRSREQQLEIEALLDFVHGRGSEAAKARGAAARPTTVGLSANQVGIMKQICVADLALGRRGYHDMYALVNPRIVWRSKAVVEKAEGCVNFPTTWGVTRRSRSVRVAAWDRSGNEVELKLTGWPAVLMQHEIDHLNGQLFIDRLVDPRQAYLVRPDDYVRYRKHKLEWDVTVDVTADVVKPTTDSE